MCDIYIICTLLDNGNTPLTDQDRSVGGVLPLSKREHIIFSVHMLDNALENDCTGLQGESKNCTPNNHIGFIGTITDQK